VNLWHEELALLKTNRQRLLAVACVCLAISALVSIGSVDTGRIPWTDIGLFFGFAAFLY
jgi:hypothetical protein